MEISKGRAEKRSAFRRMTPIPQGARAAVQAVGRVTLERREGDRPLSIMWRLQRALPVALFRRYRVLRA
jgi:hypothetical protein